MEKQSLTAVYGIFIALVLVNLLGCFSSDSNDQNSTGTASVSDSSKATSKPSPTINRSASKDQSLKPQSPDRLPLENPAVTSAVNDKKTQPNKKQSQKKHDKIFVNWKKPKLAIVISGNMHGYIEPCGCTGLANQKGGLMRRHTFLNMLREDKKWNVVTIDSGDFVRRYGRQANIKYQVSTTALKKMNYHAIGIGPKDLRLSEIATNVATEAYADNPLPYVAANVTFEDIPLKKVQVITAGDQKIGVTSIIDKKYQAAVQNDELKFSEVNAALQSALKKMASEKCTVKILICYSSLTKCKQLAQKFPKFDIVVTSAGGTIPPRDIQKVKNTNTMLIELGEKGMYLNVMALFEDAGKNQWKYQRVTLDDRYQDSKAIKLIMTSYQDQLKSIWQKQGLAALGIPPSPHPSGRKFVGSHTCAECHEDEYAIWKKTPHSHATNSIVNPPERGDVGSRHFDPECVSCHVVGWQPDKFFPYKSGFVDLKKTPKMQHVGCENCHGPGSIHVAIENGDLDVSEEETEKQQIAMRLSLTKKVNGLSEARNRCLQCHDLDNSPDFHQEGAFEKYWKQIKH